MNTLSLETIESNALKLPPAERSHLLERLLASLDADPDVETAWELVADRREAEVTHGDAHMVDGPQATAQLKARLAQ